jgi:hypothetical protein
MTPADLARKNSISLEAKKDALAQRQNGDWKVSFTVQGNDMDPRLTQAPMGTRYAVVLVEIGDDELPVQQKENRAKPDPASPQDSRPDRAKRMDWRDMQPAAQAALRCDQPAFRTFLMEQHSFRPREANSPDEAAEFIRSFFGIKSRSELGTDHRKRVLWKQLDDQFQAWKALEHA